MPLGQGETVSYSRGGNENVRTLLGCLTLLEGLVAAFIFLRFAGVVGVIIGGYFWGLLAGIALIVLCVSLFYQMDERVRERHEFLRDLKKISKHRWFLSLWTGLSAGYLIAVVAGMIWNDGHDARREIADVPCSFEQVRGVIVGLGPESARVQPLIRHWTDHSPWEFKEWFYNQKVNTRDPVMIHFPEERRGQFSSPPVPGLMVVYTEMYCAESHGKNGAIGIRPLPKELLAGT